MNAPGYRQTKYGFYQLDPMPTEAELIEYYSQQYYNNPPTNLARLQQGNDEEIYWLENTIWLDIDHFLFSNLGNGNILDYGSGTGHFANFMRQRKWGVLEYDLANDHSPTFLGKKFVAVMMLHVLEHVRDPKNVLDDIRSVLLDDGILVIVVPNDFSPLQMELKEKHGEYWLRYPDHVNYFNRGSLLHLLADTGFRAVHHTVDFPMEIFLLFGFDYLSNSLTGNACHNKRRMFELSMSIETRRQLYMALRQANIGRNLIVYAQKT